MVFSLHFLFHKSSLLKKWFNEQVTGILCLSLELMRPWTEMLTIQSRSRFPGKASSTEINYQYLIKKVVTYDENDYHFIRLSFKFFKFDIFFFNQIMYFLSLRTLKIKKGSFSVLQNNYENKDFSLKITFLWQLLYHNTHCVT